MQFNSLFYKKVAVFSVLFFVVAVLFVFSAQEYPVMGGDSIYYVATAINYELGNGLTNKLSPMFLVSDPSGAGRFLVFPPLFPLVLSWLMSTGTPQSAYMAMFVLYAVAIFLAGFVFWKFFVSTWEEASWH